MPRPGCLPSPNVRGVYEWAAAATMNTTMITSLISNDDAIDARQFMDTNNEKSTKLQQRYDDGRHIDKRSGRVPRALARVVGKWRRGEWAGTTMPKFLRRLTT